MDSRFISMKISLVNTAHRFYPNYVHFFEQANYGPAFRTAAHNLEFGLLALLLRDDVKAAIGLDVNGQSPSTGMTALDYAFESPVKNGQSGKVVDLLIKAGAKTQDELCNIENSDSQEEAQRFDMHQGNCTLC